ncbi:MAG: serine/threonine protein kinase [bacterium]|nr:serine/threonine protein kinase [bacterium]
MNPSPPPQTIGRYKLIRPLGSGAMGDVYLAEDPNIDRRLAVKTVRLMEGAADVVEERKQRLLREAKAAGRLLHPHVVTLFDAGEAEGLLYLAFEFVDGSDLSQRLRSAPPLTLRQVLQLLREVASALDYAHQQHIVHRDVKPSNILIGPDGEAKVADFGIAKLKDKSTELTRTGSVVGSPQYMSPEQIRGESLDGRSDLFSLGVVAYELLSSSRPFDGDTLSTLVFQILSQEPVSIDRLRPGLPPRLVQLVHSMLIKDREERVASAGEVMRELAAIEREVSPQELAAPAPEETSPTLPSLPPPLPPPPLPPRSPRGTVGTGTYSSRRVGPWLLVVGLVGLALLVGAGWWFKETLRSGRSPVPETTETQAPETSTAEPVAVAGEPAAEEPPPEEEIEAAERDAPTAVAVDEPRREAPAESSRQPTPTPRAQTAVTSPPPERSAPRASPPAAAATPAAPTPEPSPADDTPADDTPAAAADDARSEFEEAARQAAREVHSGLSLQFRVVPDDAIVVVRGASDSRSVVHGAARNFDPKHDDARSVELPGAGDYLVFLRKEGYPDYVISLQAAASGGSQARLIKATLSTRRRSSSEPLVIAVRQAIGFSGYPARTAVFVDGVQQGFAADYPGGIGKANNLQLASGSHDVRLDPPGYRPVHIQIEVRRDAPKKKQVIPFH